MGDDGSLRRIYWRKELQRYCPEKKVNNKRVYESIDPQPSADSVVIFLAILQHLEGRQHVQAAHHMSDVS